MTYQHYYNGNKIWKENTINKWHTNIITMETKYGKRIPLTMTYQNYYNGNKIWKENTINTWHTKIITMETKYGKRIPLTNDIPKLLQWKQNMEREYH